jgi:CRISPR-associated protein Cas5d
MDNGPPLVVKVWGDFACFTRPEMKVERVSYPVMTPSAARGVLEAIFWKPEMQWRIRQIEVLRPVRWVSLVRNEINSKASERSARQWAESGGGYFADDDRAQRHTLALRDVAYTIRADIVLTGRAAGDNVAKYRDQFRRRVSRGQCFSTPYLGCREFAAEFSEPRDADRPIELDQDLGLMLFDIDYNPDGTSRGSPRFFEARIERGVLTIPPDLYNNGGA